MPKPLIPVAGKPIVHRLVEDIDGVLNQKIDEVAFIIHESFGKKVEEDLRNEGFDVLVFVPSIDEEDGLVTCGNLVLGGGKVKTDDNIIKIHGIKR